MTRSSKSEHGLASIVIVGILITLLTLISLGFARITSRSINNATDDQSNKAADYAAQSGLNDTVAYIKGKATDVSPSQVQADQCNDLLDPTSEFRTFYANPNLSGDRNIEYRCILVDPEPPDLRYENVPAFKSQVTKMTTVGSGSNPNRQNKLMVSWQASDTFRDNVVLPNTPTLSLSSEAFWSSSNYAPMLRLTLYPVPQNPLQGLSAARANARTYFLYPCTPPAGSCPATIGSVHYTNEGGAGAPMTPDGTLVPVNCNFKGDDFQTASPQIFDSTADYDCNAVIDNFRTSANPFGQQDYFYARITPLYVEADVKLKIQQVDGDTALFSNVQSIVDVTAKSAGTAKRLQARVDIGTSNIPPKDNAIPEYAMRSAMMLCKRLSVIAPNTTSTPNTCAPLIGRPECSDRVDNSDPEDTIADYPYDPGCTSEADDDETNPPPPPPCGPSCAPTPPPPPCGPPCDPPPPTGCNPRPCLWTWINWFNHNGFSSAGAASVEYNVQNASGCVIRWFNSSGGQVGEDNIAFPTNGVGVTSGGFFPPYSPGGSAHMGCWNTVDTNVDPAHNTYSLGHSIPCHRGGNGTCTPPPPPPPTVPPPPPGPGPGPPPPPGAPRHVACYDPDSGAHVHDGGCTGFEHSAFGYVNGFHYT